MNAGSACSSRPTSPHVLDFDPSPCDVELTFLKIFHLGTQSQAIFDNMDQRRKKVKKQDAEWSTTNNEKGKFIVFVVVVVVVMLSLLSSLSSLLFLLLLLLLVVTGIVYVVYVVDVIVLVVGVVTLTVSITVTQPDICLFACQRLLPATYREHQLIPSTKAW